MPTGVWGLGLRSACPAEVPSKSALDWMPDSRSFIAVTADTIRRESHITRVYVVPVVDCSERQKQLDDQNRKSFSRNWGQIYFVSGTTGRQVRRFTQSSYRQWAVSISPSGKFVAVSGCCQRNENNVVEIWDTESALLLRSLPHRRQSLAVAWAPDGKRIASGASNVLMLWDALTGSELSEHIVHPAIIRSIAWSADGTRLATGSADTTIRIWDGDSLKNLFLLQGHQSWVESIAWSPDGITLASASRDGSIRFWNAEAGVELLSLSGPQGHADAVVSLAFSPDGRFLVSGGKDGAKIWFVPHFIRNHTLLKARALLKQGQDLARQGKLTQAISVLEDLVEDQHVGVEAKHHLARIRNAHDQFFANDRMGRKGYSRAKETAPSEARTDVSIPRVLRLATVFDQNPMRDIGRTGGWLKQIAWSSNQKQLASLSTRGLQIWNPIHRSRSGLQGASRTNEGGEEIEIQTIAWSPDGQRLAAGYQDGVIRIMQADGKEIRLLEKGDQPIRSVAWSPNGEMLAAHCWRGVYVWTLATGSVTQQFTISDSKHLFWHSNGVILAVGYDRVSELNISTWRSERRATLPGRVYGSALSPDGKWIAFVIDNTTIHVYCTASWSRKQVLRGHTARVNTLAWAPDSRKLASGSGGGDAEVQDYTVRLWDAVAGRQVCVLQGHFHDVQAIAWSPDGKALVTGSRWSDLLAWWLPYFAPEHFAQADSD